ncbi:MAG: DUF6371 domain-containing protein [Bacteroidales bacterium]|nr:DUF6371 domain-containing protein [Bacteroidales bacterium]MCF8458949.1 DUF6371 domain-containing protein [Bacteroidales bacterium]
MSEHRYILEPYKGMKTRFSCPSCRANRKFVRYIYTDTGQHIADHVGKCERANNCGYHYTPKEFFKQNEIFNLPTPNPTPRHITTQPKPIAKPVSFIPAELFKQSMQADKDFSRIAESNNFLRFLIQLFGVELASDAINKYFISTSKHWPGSTVFWQIDTQGKVRTGKIMLYNPITGKRIKVPFDHITWVHKKINQPGFELKQCFFGEHLLLDKTKPVAIVESEKSAIIASIYLPRFIWLATGGLENLNPDKCKPLAGRTVVLFPDLGGFDKWSNKAMELEKFLTGTKFIISDLLEKKAVEADKTKGYDLADFLLKQDWRKFRDQEKPKPVIQVCTLVDNTLENIKFQTMAAKNPELIKFVEAFDLEIVDTVEMPQVIVQTLSKNELTELALKTIGLENHTHQNKIPYLTEMLEHGIIIQAEPLIGFYYLSASTPF